MTIDFRALDKTLIIAEAGVNHEGNVETAADLVCKAASAGADAVKFQTYTPAHYVSTDQPERRARTERFCLSYADFASLAQIAKGCGIMFFSTPLHPADVDFLDQIQPVFKISSGDLTYLELISSIAAKGKPIILSTGNGTEQEIGEAVAVITARAPRLAEQGGLMLMHCVAAYPTKDEDCNLRNIHWLQRRFGLPVGYSDHTLGTKACELAIAVGAVAVEKHFTYRKEGQTFHDHHISADPGELTALVQSVRQAERFLGREERVRTPDERKLHFHLRRSIGAIGEIKAGTVVERGMLTWLRPAWGLPADCVDFVVGRKLKRTIAAGGLIRAEDVE